MIAYSFLTLSNSPKCGVLVGREEPAPARFLTLVEAKEAAPPVPSPRLTIACIQQIVADHFGFSVSHMHAATRDRRYAHPRQLAMLLCHEFTGNSLSNIGKHFGGRHHTTVLHGIREAKARNRANSTNYDALDAILQQRKGNAT